MATFLTRGPTYRYTPDQTGRTPECGFLEMPRLLPSNLHKSCVMILFLTTPK